MTRLEMYLAAIIGSCTFLLAAAVRATTTRSRSVLTVPPARGSRSFTASATPPVRERRGTRSDLGCGIACLVITIGLLAVFLAI